MLPYNAAAQGLPAAKDTNAEVSGETILQECEQAWGVKIPAERRKKSAEGLDIFKKSDKELVINTLQDVYIKNEVEEEDRTEVALVYLLKIANCADGVEVQTRNKGDGLQAYRIL